jgi:hypothetical protein
LYVAVITATVLGNHDSVEHGSVEREKRWAYVSVNTTIGSGGDVDER